MSAKEAKIKATMERTQAIAYLEDVLKSLKAKKFTVANGAESLSLEPGPTVRFEFEAVQKDDKESISLRISWRKGGDGAAQEPPLRITTEPGEESVVKAPPKSRG